LANAIKDDENQSGNERRNIAIYSQRSPDDADYKESIK
jgi:hypothetical protein